MPAPGDPRPPCARTREHFSRTAASLPACRAGDSAGRAPPWPPCTGLAWEAAAWAAETREPAGPSLSAPARSDSETKVTERFISRAGETLTTGGKAGGALPSSVVGEGTLAGSAATAPWKKAHRGQAVPGESGWLACELTDRGRAAKSAKSDGQRECAGTRRQPVDVARNSNRKCIRLCLFL